MKNDPAVKKGQERVPPANPDGSGLKNIISPHILALSLIVALASFLRLKALSFQSLWLDELWTIDIVGKGLRGIVRYCAVTDSHPPLYYLLVRGWSAVFGTGEVSLRSLSVVFGVLGTIVLYALGRELFSKRAGLAAALMLSVSAYHIEYSQEGRMYSLFIFLAILSFLFLARLVKTPGLKNTVLYTVVTVLLLYGHYFSLLLVLSQGVFIVFCFSGFRDKNKTLKALAGAALAGGLLYLPWIPVLLRQFRLTEFWAEKPKPDFFIGYFKTYLGNEPFLTVIVAALLVGYLFSRRRTDSFPRHKVLLFSWVLITLFVPYVRSFQHPAALHPRFAMVIVPALWLMAVRGIAVVKGQAVRTLVVLAVAAISLVNVFYAGGGYYRTVTKAQWREAVRFVIHNDPDNRFPVYGHSYFGVYFNTLYHRGVRMMGFPIATRRWAGRLFEKTQARKLPGLWLLESPWTKSLEPVRDALDKKMVAAANIDLHGTRAKLYVNVQDYVFSHTRVRVPLDSLVFPGRSGHKAGEELCLPCSSRAVTPGLSFEPGNYLLEVEARSSVPGLGLRAFVEGRPPGPALPLGDRPQGFRVNLKAAGSSPQRIVLEPVRPPTVGNEADVCIYLKSMSLRKVEPLADFLVKEQPGLAHTTLIIAARSDAGRKLNTDSRAALGRLGLKKIEPWPPGLSYLAVLDNGRVVFEESGRGQIIFRRKDLWAASGGPEGEKGSRVLIDGLECSKQRPGLNIVLVRDDIVRSYSCDTSSDPQNLIDD